MQIRKQYNIIVIFFIIETFRCKVTEEGVYAETYK